MAHFWSIGPSEKKTKIAAAIEKRKLLAQSRISYSEERVLRRVTEILGASEHVEAQGANAAIILTTTIGDWTVWTTSAAVQNSLEFSHTLINARDPELKRYHLSWRGRDHGNTTWDLLTTDWRTRQFETLVMLCQRFSRRLPNGYPGSLPDDRNGRRRRAQ